MPGEQPGRGGGSSRTFAAGGFRVKPQRPPAALRGPGGPAETTAGGRVTQPPYGQTGLRALRSAWFSESPPSSLFLELTISSNRGVSFPFQKFLSAGGLRTSPLGRHRDSRSQSRHL